MPKPLNLTPGDMPTTVEETPNAIDEKRPEIIADIEDKSSVFEELSLEQQAQADAVQAELDAARQDAEAKTEKAERAQAKASRDNFQEQAKSEGIDPDADTKRMLEFVNGEIVVPLGADAFDIEEYKMLKMLGAMAVKKQWPKLKIPKGDVRLAFVAACAKIIGSRVLQIYMAGKASGQVQSEENRARAARNVTPQPDQSAPKNAAEFDL